MPYKKPSVLSEIKHNISDVLIKKTLSPTSTYTVYTPGTLCTVTFGIISRIRVAAYIYNMMAPI